MTIFLSISNTVATLPYEMQSRSLAVYSNAFILGRAC